MVIRPATAAAAAAAAAGSLPVLEAIGLLSIHGAIDCGKRGVALTQASFRDLLFIELPLAG